MRVHGPLVLLCVLLSVAGLVLARGRQRAVILLLAGTAIVPVALASATTVYNWRYIVPLLPALAAAGALGAQVLAARWAKGRARERRTMVPAP